MPKQSRGIKTKEKIDQISLELFVKKGIKETTIKDIALAGEIAEGTLYRHYKSKEELAISLFTENYLAFSKELVDYVSAYTQADQKLDRLIEHFLRNYDDNPILFSYLLLSQHGMLERLQSDQPHAVDLLVEIISLGQEQGVFKDQDPNLLTALVLGLILQPAVSKTYGRLKKPLSFYQDEIISAAQNLILVK